VQRLFEEFINIDKGLSIAVSIFGILVYEPLNHIIFRKRAEQNIENYFVLDKFFFHFIPQQKNNW
jgi:hypothetical protein